MIKKLNPMPTTQKSGSECLILLLLISLSLLCTTCKGRPKFQMPKMPFITGENLLAVVTPGERDVWLAGEFGTIYHSRDGGTTWEKQQSGTENNLVSACFIDNQNGWMCGILGTIVHTSNGGKTWEQQITDTDRHLISIYFTDAQHGCAVGDMGTVITTADGGKTWNSVMEQSDIAYNCVFFADPRNGWMVGEFGSILHTSDGGKTWNKQTCKDIEPPPGDEEFAMPAPTLYAVCFKDSKRGWATGVGGTFIATEDGGKVWNGSGGMNAERLPRVGW